MSTNANDRIKGILQWIRKIEVGYHDQEMEEMNEVLDNAA